jgi:hypothetical protein
MKTEVYRKGKLIASIKDLDLLHEGVIIDIDKGTFVVEEVKVRLKHASILVPIQEIKVKLYEK